MSSAVCLSLVANLRCSGLRPQEAVAILVPAAIEAVLISFLFYTQWNKGRKHFLLIFDSYIFLALCVVDFVSKASDAISTSMAVFSVMDRAVGGLSGLPIILYILSLYLFARRHFISIIPARLQWSVKVLLTLLIPVILILAELGSLLGFSYITLPGMSPELAVRYNTPLSKTLWTLLNSAGLALLILYQFVCFCLAIYRVFRFFTHVTKPQSPGMTKTGSKGSRTNQRNMRMQGIGWIAAGIKLGAIEALLGFVPNGFGMALSRRLFRVAGRLMLAWGIYKGIDEYPGSAMFRVGSIDSIEGLPPRRIPVSQSGGLRTLISAPMTETFAKMSPTATAFHTRKKVPNAMSGLHNFDMSFVDEKGGRIGEVANTPAVMVQNLEARSLSSTGAPYEFGRASLLGTASSTFGGNSSGTRKIYPERPTFPKLRQNEKRVTLAYDGRQAPVLDIRFSAQVFPDAGKLINRLGHSPAGSISSGEDGGNQRPTLAGSRAFPTAAKSSRPTLLERTAEEIELPQVGVVLTIVRASQTTAPTAVKGNLPMSGPADGGKRGRSRSTTHKSTQSTLYNPFADPPNLSRSISSSQEIFSKRIRQGPPLSEDSLTAIHPLSSQFPPLPGSFPRPTRESPTRGVVRKAVPDDSSGPTVSEQTTRQRSNSSPRLRSLGSNAMGAEEQLPYPRRVQDSSPRTSLDQDVATRTKRRIHAHLKHASQSSSISGLAEAQWAVGQKASSARAGQSAGSSPDRTTATSAATSPFSTRGRIPRGVHIKSTSLGKADSANDMLASPITVFTDSLCSADEVLSPPFLVDRSVGRIARRALGIEQFLGEEKEKKEASQDGHGDLKQRDGSAPPSSAANVGFEDDPSRLPFPSTSRIRPRSNLDAIAIAPRPLKRSMTVDDPDARQAFAVAWRTVVPTIGSPSVGDLRTVSSVRVKRTPAPSRHRAVSSGESMQSMRVDEGQFGSLSPVSANMRSRRAIMGSGIVHSRTPTESDRRVVRKARSMKVAFVDSEVY